ncbi:MAG TPA: PAS domain S-box protein [Bryobacteraceae bacterium]|jgi:PAS domain S-box-containing protein|nr:PAS domain S-box protein [Bryobacteraceae bacterium]
MSPERSRETLDTLAGILPVAVIGLDAQGVVEMWNPGAASLFGWTGPEVLGYAVPPAIGSVRDGHFESAFPVRGKDDRPLAIDIQVAHAPSGGMLLISDPATRTKAEARLRELLEAAPDGIIEVDREGRIVMLNKATERLFGYLREELLGAPIENLLPDAMRARHVGHRAGYVAQPGTRPMGQGLTLAARRRDGSEFPVEISLSPIHSDDSFSVMAIVRDVTERRVFEERIRKANQELEVRNREIEKANQLKSEFLASMSHELRTPLHTIIGFTELIQEESQGPLNPAQKRFVGHVHHDSVHLLELINDILDLSKIEANRMELKVESLDAHEVVREALHGIVPAAEAKNIHLDDRIEGPAYVLADRVRVREIVTNLLSNAVKFTPRDGSVWLEQTGGDPGRISISVADNGMGIADADQEVIFDRFRQVGRATSGVREGTGLGLAIVKSLVEMHGGTITVKSAPGRGSCFTFTLPVDPGRSREHPVVLVIEDEPAGRELLASYLEPLGVRIEFAATGDAGIDLARRKSPDAITLDLMLPDSSGWRVLEELRTLPETRGVPIFVVSVLDKDRSAIARGATAYLQKPLNKEVLLRALREHAPQRFGNIELKRPR